MQTTFYTVKRGDTLWGLSHKIGVDVDLLARMNNLHGNKVHVLQVGQKLTLPMSTAHVDTELTIHIVDLRFKSIKHVHLKLKYDSAYHEVTTDAEGFVRDVMINDHAKGISIEFKCIDGKYILIANHATLPIGKKRLTITSRSMAVKGSYHGKPGIQRESKKNLQHEVKLPNKNVHIAPKRSISKLSGEGVASKTPISAAEIPTPINKQTRLEGGTPVQVSAEIFTEENLFLAPVNEKYRKLIIASAKHYEFTPQVLAALINTEAAQGKDGEWLADSVNAATDASGLTQFMKPAWLEMATDSRSLMNQRLRVDNGFDGVVSEGQGSSYHLIGLKGHGVNQERTKIDSADVLVWRFNPEYAIDTAALYGKVNLEKLEKRGINVSTLAPEDLAKVIYLMHHEGAGGAVAALKGTLSTRRAKTNLKSNVTSKLAAALISRFDGNDKEVKAYTYWLYELLIDKKINVAHFMIKSEGINPKSMSDIAQLLNGAAPTLPSDKPSSQVISPPTEAGAAQGWHDPLDHCTLRTAGLASKKSATFGMVRNGGTRAHQGIDLVAEPGTAIYAVANSKVVGVAYSKEHVNYGNTIILAVDINDLPQTQQEATRASLHPDATTLYFFYAHLSQIDVKQGDMVALGDKLGLTGDSGNAFGMSTIARGSHLHFEVRSTEKKPGVGIQNRVDPLPFISNLI